MPEKHLYEYAVLRVVPRVEREEFFNIGVVLYCKSKKFLQSKSYIDLNKLDALCGELTVAELESHVQAFENICGGIKQAGPIARLDMASRFRWLTAVRSTIFQTSRVHPGFCEDPGKELLKLFELLVL